MAAVKLLFCSFCVVIGAYYFCCQETLTPELVKGKRALVTGSSTGIGEQIAYQLARLGAHVLLTSRREKQLKKVATKCLKLGASSAHYVVSDMSNLTSVQNVITATNKYLGGLDYLILNHVGGTGLFGPFQGDTTAMTSSLTVNFLSYVQLTSMALSLLQESQGSITVMSSLGGRIGTPFSTSYCAAKFALEGFYSSLRSELSLQKKNISITVAVLGYINTDNAVQKMNDKVMMTAASKEECAQVVVQAGALRYPEVFYPYWSMKLLVLVRDWKPDLLAKLLNRFYILDNIL
ncbi:hydroxysteroid 11-beta-dehydrogenase 1-like protein A [Microcaecilia unicolor]|uniref:Hydroxysteroid 11-beta-dehydrogenase 1-like protein A n=1 Tax=Microcaecilia unicolor TaxID=1415580 RepID=A0A6P7ZCZ9_9AMPH|nr:hydroxysteroid 11-beta-dehydrogenase 1-like protein A [Microcaecilia unicolor]